MIDVEDATVWLRMQEPASLDAIVTSPPYGPARSADYPSPTLEEYASFTSEWLDAALDAVKPGGLVLINIGHLYRGGEISPYHLQALSAALALGWRWVEELIFFKKNANPLQGNLVTAAHEYVYVLAHPRGEPYRGGDALRRPYAEGTAERYERAWINNTAVKGSSSGRGRTLNPLGARAQSVLVHTTGKEKGNAHACPMPLDLALDLVQLAAPEGGTVADPFAGSGTTLLAAIQTGRRAVGCDVDGRSVALTQDRLRDSHVLV